MDELEKQLKNILDSPGELSRLAQMAQELLSPESPPLRKGGAEPSPPVSPPLRKGGAERSEAGGSSPALPDAGALRALLTSLTGDGGSGKRALVEALGPYLGEKRRKKLARAASLARAARLAGTLLAQGGGEGLL